MNEMVNQKRIFFLLGEKSAYNSSFILARELEQKGYIVLYLVFGREAKYIKDNGFRYELLDPRQSRKRHLRGLGAYVKYYYIYQYIVNRKIEQLILRDRPCLCLVNVLSLPLTVKLLRHQVPVVNYVNEFVYRFSNKVPAVFSALPPGEEWYRGIANVYSWISTYFQFCRKKGLFCLYGLFWLSRRPFRKLDYLGEIRSYGGIYYWCEYGYRLKAPDYFSFAAEIDIPGKKHRSAFVYGGAHIYRDRNDNTFFELKAREGQKIIYCSLGTWSLQHLKQRERLDFYNQLLAAVGPQPHLYLVLSLPKEDLENLLLPIPKNVQVHSFVPQLKVLSATDVFITHGGSSSIKEAISFGVPMIVFPGAVDQPGNAARVVYHKLGVRGNFRRVSSKKIARMINYILSNREIKAAVHDFKQMSGTQYGCSKGVSFLEDMINTRRLPM